MNSLRRGLLMLLLAGGLFAAHSARAQIVNGSISGSVVAGGNFPVADATVTLVSQGNRTGKDNLTATTDKDGHFQIHDVPSGIYSVGATAAGFVRSTVDMSSERYLASISSGKEATEFVVFMARETIVEGRILDTDGSPSAGASTDTNGNYQIRGIAPGNYVILSLIPFEPSALEQNEWRGYPASVDSGGVVSMNLPFLGVVLPTP